MARSSEDLKALIMTGESYNETIEIEYLGELFAVQIRPLTEAELTDVQRTMKLSATMVKAIMQKIKLGKKLTPAEEETAKKEAIESVLTDGTIDVGDLNYMEFVQNREYCKRGIVDKGLRELVPNFRYGLTEMISKRIQTISNVPPQVVANFFGQKKDS